MAKYKQLGTTKRTYVIVRNEKGKMARVTVRNLSRKLRYIIWDRVVKPAR